MNLLYHRAISYPACTNVGSPAERFTLITRRLQMTIAFVSTGASAPLLSRHSSFLTSFCAKPSRVHVAKSSTPTATLRWGSRWGAPYSRPSFPSGTGTALQIVTPDVIDVAVATTCTASSIPQQEPNVVQSIAHRLLQRLVTLAAALRRLRKVHGAGLRLARAGAGVVLATAALIVSRGALSGVSTITAPALPRIALPAGLALPEGVARAIRPFTESFGIVFLSEFGDKSMFATALMAMKHSPFVVLVGALAALTVMTLIACFLGQLMHLLPSNVTHYSSIALFVFFGIQMIIQSRSLPDTPGGKGGERADAEELVGAALASGGGAGTGAATIARKESFLSILAKVSSLIFVAEWCDRSMLATMALAASNNSLAVVGGATLANILCTGVAVGAATLVASKISERTVALVSGILFEFFAVFTFLEGPDS